MRVTGNRGQIVAGIGRLGKVQTFDWSSVTHVWEGTHFNPRGVPAPNISILTDRDTKFGAFLNDKRRKYMIHGLCLLRLRT